MVLGEFEKGMGARGDDPAAQLQGLRDRARRGLPDFEIRKHHRVAQRHAGQKRRIAQCAHEMNPRREIARMRAQELAQAAIGRKNECGRALCARGADPVVQRRLDIGVVEQSRDIRVDRAMRGDLVRVDAAKEQQMMIIRQMMQRLDRGSEAFVFVQEAKHADQHRVGRQRVEHRLEASSAPFAPPSLFAKEVNEALSQRPDSGRALGFCCGRRVNEVEIRCR